MKLEVSIGESVDKLSILELKHTKISDPLKLEEIQKEIDAIQEVQIYKTQLPFFYKLLYFVNDKIWTMTDEIKCIDINNSQYSSLAYEIFDYNQKRFRIKHFFNKLLDSSIQEQKSYASTICLLTISNENILFSKLSEIFYLSIAYDILIIDSIYKDLISKILIIPSIKLIDYFSVENNYIKPINIINLSEYSISNDLQNIFSLEPIKYVCSGMFGDFIHSLSVINEKYYVTGRKGILYISNHHGGDEFRYGIEKTFEDTFEIIKNQPYILSYSIYKETDNIECCINLNDWRNSPFLYNKNWHFIYTSTYNISWGKHPWITLPSTLKKDSNWENKIIINTIAHRFPYHTNFYEVYEKHGDNLIFVSMEKSNYDNFIENYNLPEIKYHMLTSFTELCIILSSCKLFIGSLSGPLAVAYAIHTPCIIDIHPNSLDAQMINNLQEHLPFILKIN